MVWQVVPQLLFQSTLPRGERLVQDCETYKGNADFNPRSREGSDPDPDDVAPELDVISIHAPARGATNLPTPGGVV